MSVEVDNRVVQMEFDNKNFEQGVAVSLKTLEKLKKALQLDKAVDSLQHVDQAINRFDSSGLTRMEQSLANLESRFSSIGTIGARVLENLTDKAVQMSSRMLQSIFVEPVQQGLSKYDEMMNSKQTMKAALGSGMMSEIDESLATLQHYSDETSYSFTTMTGALANFVSAGQKNLPKTTKSITGIANAAAKAGIGISQATPAFNAFSKAIGAGKMTLMQWQSLELMNFTTAEFRQRMIDAGLAEGTLKKDKKGNIKAGKKTVTAANMRDTLSQGWATAAVMQRVLGQYADDKDAYDAAQKAKSFKDVWDSVMDAVSSSWMETYKLIFGDLQEAIDFFTDLSNGLYEWVDIFNSRRNQVVQDWRGNGLGKTALEETIKLKQAQKTFEETTAQEAEHFRMTMEKDGKKIEQFYKDGKYFERVTTGKGKKRKVEEREIALDDTGERYYKDGKWYLRRTFEYDTDEQGKKLRKGKKRTETKEIEITLDERSVEELQEELDGIEDGRDYLINGFSQLGSVIIEITSRIDKAFGAVFGDNLGKTLLDLSRDFSNFGDSVNEYFNPLRLYRIENVATAFFSVLDWGRAIVSALLSPIKTLGAAFLPVADSLLSLAGSVSMVFINWHNNEKGFDKIASWGDKLSAALSPITELFNNIATKINAVATTVYGRFNDGDKALGRFGKILNGLAAAADIAVTVISWLVSGLSNVVVFLAPIAGAIGDAALSVFAGIGEALSWINGSGKVPEFLGKISDSLTKLGEGFSKWFSETKIGKRLTRLKNQFSNFFGLLKKDPAKAWNAIKFWSKGFVASLSKVAGPIKDVGKTISTWFANTSIGKKLDSFKGRFQKFWSIFKRDPSKAINVLRTTARAYKDSFLKALSNSKILTSAKQHIDGFFKTIREKGPQVWQNIKNVGSGIVEWIGNTPVVKKLSNWKKNISDFFELWKNDPERAKFALENFKKSAIQALKKIVRPITDAGKAFSEWFSNTALGKGITRLKNRLINFFGLLKKDPAKAWDALKYWAKPAFDAFSNLVSPITKAGTAISNWFANTAVGKRLSRFKRQFQNFWEVFKKDPKKAIGILGMWASSYKNKFLQAISNNPLLNAAKEKIGGFFQTIKERAPKAWDNLKKTASAIKNSIVESEGFKKVKTFVGDFFNGIKEGAQNFDIRDVPKKIGEWLGGIKEQFEKSAVGQWIISKWEQLKSWADSMIDKFGLRDKLDSIKESLTNFKDRLGTVFGDIGIKINTFLTLLRRDPKVAMQYLRNVFAPIIDPIESAFEKMKQWFAEKKEQLIGMFTNLFSFGKEKDVLGDDKDSWLGKISGFLNGILGLVIHPIEVIGSKLGGIGKYIAVATGVMGFITAWNVNQVMNSISSIINNKILKRKDFFGRVTDTMKAFAEAMLMMAAAFAIVALIPTNDLIKSALTFAGAIAIMVGVGYLIKRLDLTKSIVTMRAFGMAMLGFAGAVLIIVMAMKLLDAIEWNDFLGSLGKLTIILGITIAAMWAFSKLTAKSHGVQGQWKPLIAFAAGILLLSLAIAFLGWIKPDQLQRGLFGVIGLMVMLIAAAKVMSENKIKSTDVFPYILFAVAVGMLISSVKKIGNMESDKLLWGMGSILVIIAALVGMSVIMTKSKSQLDPKAAISYVFVAIAVFGLALAVEELGKMDPDSLKQGLLALGALLIGIAGLSVISKFTDPKGLLTIAGVAAILVIALHFFVLAMKDTKNLDADKIIKIVAALTIAIMMLSATAGLLGAIAGPAVAGFAALAAGIVLIGGALAIAGTMIAGSMVNFAEAMFVLGSNLESYNDFVALIDFNKLEASVTFIKHVADAAVYVNNKSASFSGLNSLGSLLVAIGADLRLYATLASNMNIESMNASVNFVKDFSDMAVDVGGKNYGDFSSFGAMIRTLSADLKLFSILTTGINVTDGTTSMGTVVNEISTLYDKLTGLKDIGNIDNVITGIGAAIRLYYKETSGIVPEDGEPADLTNLQSILSSIALALPDSETVNKISTYSVGSENDLTGFATGIVAVGTAFSDINDQVSEISQDTINKIKSLFTALSQLRTSLTPQRVDISFMGVFHKAISPVEGGDQDPLGTFANDIVQLGGALSGFSTSVSSLYGENGKSKSVGYALEVLDDIQTLRDKLINVKFDFLTVFSGYETPLSTFARDITALGGGLSSFVTSVENIDAAKMLLSIGALSFFTLLNSSLTPVGSVLSFFAGEKNLGIFGSRIATLGNGLARFIDAIGNRQFDNVAAAMTPMTELADIESKLSEKGGIKQLFTGTKDLGDFASNLEKIGEGAGKFADGITGKDFSNAKASSELLTDLAGVQNTLLVPQYTFDAFGTGLINLGDGLSKVLDAFSKGIKNKDEMLAFITDLSSTQSTLAKPGSNNYESFGKGLQELGPGLSAVANAFDSQIKNKDEMLTFITELNTKEQSLSKPKRYGFADFGKGISELGTGLSSVIDAFAKGIKNRTEGIGLVGDLITKGNSLTKPAYSLSDFGKGVTKLGEGMGKILDAFGKSMNNNTAGIGLIGDLIIKANYLKKPAYSLSDFGKGVEALGKGLSLVLDAFAKGVSNKDDVMALVERIANFSTTYLENGVSQLSTFGDQLAAFGTKLVEFETNVSGFTYENVDQAIDALNRLVTVANRAGKGKAGDGAKNIRQMLEVFNKKGWGLDSEGNLGEQKTVAQMASETATDFVTSFNTAIENLQNGTGEGMIPTLRVRPVLDTSGVEAGVGEVNGLLGGIDTSSLSLQISAIMQADADNNASVLQRLDLTNSYLASIINDNNQNTAALSNDVVSVYNQIGDLATAMMNLKIVLDDDVIVGRIFRSIDEAIGGTI